MDKQEFFDKWYRLIVNDGQITIADILEYAPKGLQLYYKSDKFEGIVYFNNIVFSSVKKKNIYIIVDTEPIDNHMDQDDELTIIKTTTLRIKNTSITKTHLYPSDEYLSWKDWQYILFPKSIGAVICGMENKHFYIINDTEMVDEEHHFVYNMNTDATLPLFSYADINKTKFKDIDCSEFIDKRTDAILFENNNINDVIKSLKTEEPDNLTEHEKLELLNNDNKGFMYMDKSFMKLFKNCKTKEDIIKTVSDKYGPESVESDLIKAIPSFWEDILNYVNKNDE